MIGWTRPTGWVLLTTMAASPWVTSCSPVETTNRATFDVVGWDRGRSRRTIDFASLPKESLVQLRVRRSRIAEWIALHPWFLCYDSDLERWESWEVHAWREMSEGVLSRTVMREYSDGRPPLEAEYRIVNMNSIRLREELVSVRTGSSAVVLCEWRGEEARRLLEVMRRPDDYPYRDTYRVWPGPNSNTYCAWVLREAGKSFDLHPMMIGKDYCGWLGFGASVSTTRTGLQLESPLVGLKVGLLDGAELHVLTLTFGVDFWPPAFKTPVGRFGWPE